VVERFGNAVEHKPDAHACSEHHRHPGDGAEFRLLAVLAQRDVAELAQGKPQDEHHEQGRQDHKQPSCVFHHPVQGTGRGRGEAVPADESPNHEGNGDDSRNPEGDLIEGQFGIPACRNGVLGFGGAQLFEDLVVFF
jgi:hypothetical protein